MVGVERLCMLVGILVDDSLSIECIKLVIDILIIESSILKELVPSYLFADSLGPRLWLVLDVAPQVLLFLYLSPDLCVYTRGSLLHAPGWRLALAILDSTFCRLFCIVAEPLLTFSRDFEFRPYVHVCCLIHEWRFWGQI